MTISDFRSNIDLDPLYRLVLILLIIFFTVLFVVSFGSLLYSYLIYPIILFIKADEIPVVLPFIPMEDLPGVSFIIICDDNDAEKLKNKIQNTMELDYPGERLEIIVAASGEDQGIDEVVKGFEPQGIKLVKPPHPMSAPLGRTLTANFAVRQATMDILVFSDVDGLFNPNAVQILVKSLFRPFVGVVSGRVLYNREQGNSNIILRLYRKLLHNWQSSESGFGTLTFVSNYIHAVRREDYHPIEKDIPVGLALPFEAACGGKRSVYAPEAISLKTEPAYETDFEALLNKSVSAAAFTRLFFKNIRRVQLNDFVFSIISGRILKWLTPYIILTMFVSILFLSIFSTFFLILLSFCVITGLALLLPVLLNSFGKKLHGTGPFILLCTVFGAFLIGFYRYFIEKRPDTYA